MRLKAFGVVALILVVANDAQTQSCRDGRFSQSQLSVVLVYRSMGIVHGGRLCPSMFSDVDVDALQLEF